MDDDTQLLLVPRRLDDPPRFLFWDFDVAILFMAVQVFGIMAGAFFTFMVLGLGAAYALQRMKSGKQRGYSLHVLYWHLPFATFKRTPRSSEREFIG